MNQPTTQTRKNAPVNNVPGKPLESFCMAALGFLTVILGNLLFVTVVSHLLDYNTKITFGRVVITPFENKYWSSNRVLLLYGLPVLVYTLTGLGLAFYLNWAARNISALYWYLYWCMVFCITFATAQFITAPIAITHTTGHLYHGIAVVMNWWGVSTVTSIFFAFVALAANLLMGFVTYRVLLQLSPGQAVVFSKSNQQLVLLRYFVAPLILLFPVAMVLAYPHSVLFYLIMFVCAALWYPGYVTKTQDGYRLEHIMQHTRDITFSYKWLAAVVAVFILIRIFL